MPKRDLLTDPRLIEARSHFADGARASRDWDSEFGAALKKWGEHGPLISGCGRDHFPEGVKFVLRSLARAVSSHNDMAMTKRPRGVRRETLHKLARLVVKHDGGGRYGYGAAK